MLESGQVPNPSKEQVVTATDLAAHLGFPASHIRRLIRQVRSAFPDYIKEVQCFPASRHGHGRSALSFHLNHDRVATFPETAFVLLQLLSFKTDDAFRVPRAEFEEAMSVKLEVALPRIRGRIEWGLSVGYVESILPGFLHPMEKIHRDREYLQLLASPHTNPMSNAYKADLEGGE